MGNFNKDISAKLSNLMYSDALNINEPRTNGDSHTVYDQFYTKTNEGKFVFRDSVDAKTKSYLNSNPEVVEQIHNYNVVAISGDNVNGYAGMVVSPRLKTSEALVVNRGTEPTSITDIATDIVAGVDNIFTNDNYEVSQLGSANALLKEASKNQPDI